MKDLNQTLATIADQLNSAVVAHGPQAWATMLEVKRLDCVSTLIITGVWTVVLAIIALVGALAGRRIWLAGRKIEIKQGYDLNEQEACPFIFGSYGLAACGVFAAAFSIGNIFALSNQWLWIGAFSPNIAVAHDIISKVMQ